MNKGEKNVCDRIDKRMSPRGKITVVRCSSLVQRKRKIVGGDH